MYFQILLLPLPDLASQFRRLDVLPAANSLQPSPASGPVDRCKPGGGSPHRPQPAVEDASQRTGLGGLASFSWQLRWIL